MNVNRIRLSVILSRLEEGKSEEGSNPVNSCFIDLQPAISKIVLCPLSLGLYKINKLFLLHSVNDEYRTDRDQYKKGADCKHNRMKNRKQFANKVF